MSIKTLLLAGALGYGYLYLKNNNILTSGLTSDSSNTIGIPSTTVSNSNSVKVISPTEVLINILPIGNENMYQVVYDVVYNGKRYTLFVLKNWVRVDAPKPFIMQQEYNGLADIQKQKYHANMMKAGSYAWYQAEKVDTIYTISQNNPMYPVPGLPGGEILSKPIPIGFIPAYSYSTDIVDVNTIQGSGINISTPVNKSVVPIVATNEIGITIPISNLLQLKKLLYNYNITDLYQVSSKLVNGIEVNKYLINPAASLVDTIYNSIQNSNIAYDVQKCIGMPEVKTVDTSHPMPLTFSTIVKTVQAAVFPISTMFSALVSS